jgi:hypothetical protein
MDRREFVIGVGMAVLTVQCLPLMAHASVHPPTDGEEEADDLIIHSGPGLFRHVHDLRIPYAVLNAPPPQGIKLTTTESLYHQHSIALTQNELAAVRQGGTVTQKASSHLFVIELAKQQQHPDGHITLSDGSNGRTNENPHRDVEGNGSLGK